MTDPKRNGKDERPPTVHARLAPSTGRRLQRPEPTTCGNGTPLRAERPVLRKRADGTYELMGTAARLAGLARWILSFGADATVETPDRLRRRVAAEARRVSQQYHDAG